MKKNNQFKVIYLIISLLFFGFIVTCFIFLGTDIEYNLNQQIARGYISRDSLFFEIDNPSFKTARIAEINIDNDGNPSIISTDSDTIEISDEGIIYNPNPIEASLPGFELSNPINNSTGLTSIETILSSGSTDYFAALHSGLLRAVYYQGNISLPPCTYGHFFTSDECLSNKAFAVIGKDYESQIYARGNKKYILYQNREFEVVGITGLPYNSPLDSLIFVNLGSLLPEEQINGIFYIDSSTDINSVFSEFCDTSKALLGCNLSIRETPTALIDIVSGGMYLKKLLKFFMIGLFILTYISVLTQFVRHQSPIISILKISGISSILILKQISKKSVKECLLGIFIGTLLMLICILKGLFLLPSNFLYSLALKIFIISLILVIVWILILFIAISLNNPRKVVKSI